MAQYYDLEHQTADLLANLPSYNSSAINVLNPKYGAKGDGVTGDSGAIQGAINDATVQAGLNGRADVWLPSGYNYRLDGRLNFKQGVRLVCDGAIITPDWSAIGSSFPAINVGGVTLTRGGIRGGTWLGAIVTGGTAETVNNIIFNVGVGGSVQNFLFQDMTCQGFGGPLFYLRNPLNTYLSYVRGYNVNGLTGNQNVVNFQWDGSAGVNPNPGNVGMDHCHIDGTVGAAVSYICNQNGTFQIADKTTYCDFFGATGATGSAIPGSVDYETAQSGQVYWDHLVQGCNIVLTAGSATSACISGANGQITNGKFLGNTLINSGSGAAFKWLGVGQAQDNNCVATIADLGTGGLTYINNSRNRGKTAGTATLVAGTVTVNNIDIQTGDTVLLAHATPGGTMGHLTLGTITNQTSFVINSSSASDTSVVYWQIMH